MHPKHYGSPAEIVACAWLLSQGYEVFRNVSTHGAIDIIAMKNGELTYFDVKRHKGYIKPYQRELGVKALLVNDDGSCKIYKPPPIHREKRQDTIDRAFRA